MRTVAPGAPTDGCSAGRSRRARPGIAQAEPPDDLLPDRGRRGRGQREADRRAERLGLRAQHHVVGPEIVTPLADQVRLVDREQARARAPLSVSRVSSLASCSGDRNTNVSELARGQQRRRPLPGRLPRVQHDRVQAGRAQVGELIVLERDQRRDDDGRARPQQPGQLVDGRLPGPGRQHGQHVAARDQRLDRAAAARGGARRSPVARARAPRSRPQLFHRCLIHLADPPAGRSWPFLPWLGQRSDRNAARISSEKRSGCSQAAKWPPRSSRL